MLHRPIEATDLEWSYTYENWSYICNIDYYWEPGEWTVEYPNANHKAVTVWEKAVLADSGEIAWQNVLAVLTRQLDVTVPYPQWCMIILSEEDDDQCLPEVLAAIIVELANLLEDDIAPINRESDVVYLTGHRTFFRAYHTTIEYKDPISTIRTWRSAAPSCFLALCPGAELHAELDRSTDRWNITLGVINSGIPAEPADSHFQRISVAAAHYEVENCLLYEGVPGTQSLPGGENGYNSNSFTAGLIDKTLGVPSPPLDYIGSDRPVPADWFTSSPPPCP